MNGFEGLCGECWENDDGDWDVIDYVRLREFLDVRDYDHPKEMERADLEEAKYEGLIEMNKTCGACGSDSRYFDDDED